MTGRPRTVVSRHAAADSYIWKPRRPPPVDDVTFLQAHEGTRSYDASDFQQLPGKVCWYFDRHGNLIQDRSQLLEHAHAEARRQGGSLKVMMRGPSARVEDITEEQFEELYDLLAPLSFRNAALLQELTTRESRVKELLEQTKRLQRAGAGRATSIHKVIKRFLIEAIGSRGDTQSQALGNALDECENVWNDVPGLESELAERKLLEKRELRRQERRRSSLTQRVGKTIEARQRSRTGGPDAGHRAATEEVSGIAERTARARAGRVVSEAVYGPSLEPTKGDSQDKAPETPVDV